MLNLDFLTVSEVFDPGFTVVGMISPDEGEYYIKNKEGIIVHSAPIPDYDWTEVKAFRWGDMEPLKKFIQKIGESWQFKVGWRISKGTII